MGDALRKLGALLTKDVVDLAKNPTMIVSCLLPVALVLFYRFVLGDAASQAGSLFEYFLLTASLCMTVGMVGSMTLVSGIAEEKEKHTLRTLMLSNVSLGQVVLSKALVSLGFVLVVALLCFAVAGAGWGLLPAYLLAAVLGAMPVILVSLVMGLASRDQMTAGLYSVPIMLVALLPLFGSYGGVFATVARYAPTGGMDALLLMSVEGGISAASLVEPLAVTLVWTFAGALLLRVLYPRLASDN